MTGESVSAVTFTVPLPPPECHPNRRAHRVVRARKNAAYRGEVYLLVRQEFGPNGHYLPRFERARVELVYRTRREHDADNLMAYSKGLIDTLCAPQTAADGTPRLGIVPDDRADHLEVTARWEKAERGETPGVRVTVTPVASAGAAQATAMERRR